MTLDFLILENKIYIIIVLLEKFENIKLITLVNLITL